MEEKLKNLDNFLNKKILGSLQELASDTRQRLENIERGAEERQDLLKKDLIQRVTKMKDEINKVKEEMREQNIQTEEEIKRSHKEQLDELFAQISKRKFQGLL